MKKFIYISIAIFTLPLFLISCSNQYDGGIYTGSSMSAKKPEKDIEKETIVDAPQKVKKEIINEIKSEKTISEENYK